MEIRPHHLLCTQTYAGKGYSEDFTRLMDKVTEKFCAEEKTKIRLVFSTDILCSQCPNKEGENLCKDNLKVSEMDRKTAEYFSLEEKEYIYQELIKEINGKMTAEIRKDICSGCEWKNLCF